MCPRCVPVGLFSRVLQKSNTGATCTLLIAEGETGALGCEEAGSGDRFSLNPVDPYLVKVEISRSGFVVPPGPPQTAGIHQVEEELLNDLSILALSDLVWKTPYSYTDIPLLGVQLFLHGAGNFHTWVLRS